MPLVFTITNTGKVSVTLQLLGTSPHRGFPGFRPAESALVRRADGSGVRTWGVNQLSADVWKLGLGLTVR